MENLKLPTPELALKYVSQTLGCDLPDIAMPERTSLWQEESILQVSVSQFKDCSTNGEKILPPTTISVTSERLNPENHGYQYALRQFYCPGEFGNNGDIQERWTEIPARTISEKPEIDEGTIFTNFEKVEDSFSYINAVVGPKSDISSFLKFFYPNLGDIVETRLECFENADYEDGKLQNLFQITVASKSDLAPLSVSRYTTNERRWGNIVSGPALVNKISDATDGGSDRYHNEVTAHSLPEISPLTVFKKQTY